MSPDTVFRRCVAFTLSPQIEGGFVNDPADPGGATSQGISLRAVVGLDDDGDGELDFDLDRDGDVDVADIRLIEKFPERRDEFYRRRYFDEMRAGEMRWPWPLFAFDGAVNHGPAASAVLLQKALGVARDGIVGPATLRAIELATQDAYRRAIAERHVLYHDITVSRTRRMGAEKGERFIRGWSRRLVDLTFESLSRQ